MLFLFLLCAFSASTFTIGKTALEYTTPLFLIGVRLTVSGVLFLVYYYFKYKQMPTLKAYDYWVLAQVAFASFYFAFTMEFSALQYLPSSKTAILYNLSPVIAACFSYFVFNEKMTPKKILGLAICLLSFLPILMESTPSEGSKFFLFLTLPELEILLAVISFTYGWVVMRKAIKRHFIPTVFVNGVGMLWAGIAALATVYLFDIPYTSSYKWIHFWIPVTQVGPFLLWSSLLIVIGSVICYALYGYLLHKYTATFVTLGELATPLFAALYGWAFLNESITISFYFSMLVLGIGSFIFYQEEKRLGYFEHV